MPELDRESLREILEIWVSGNSLSASSWEKLQVWALADESRAKAFGITSENVAQLLDFRSHLFHQLHSQVIEYCQKKGFSSRALILETLWELWLPLAIQLATWRRDLPRPLIQGILGGQGTGKTTLAAILRLILKLMGYETLSISIDDLYKTYAERQELQKQDPRLIWRGPPGTHDVKLGIEVLNQLRQQQTPVEIPRFDKSMKQGAGDRTTPEIVQKADIVLFEGWFVGVRPIDRTTFDSAPAPIVTLNERTFARDINFKLQEYVPLWELLDRLITLYPVDYRLSLEWRKQAEQEMIAAGKNGMTDEEIEQFVAYFWRSLHPELFIKPLVKNPNLVDLVIEINPDHSHGKVYQPGERR
ncbi:glycerate kinase [Phormidium sp. LEGE 05292]|uniref:glycerate kinase n=1 Tax=[Phormidium] sp. LEGE 05292 TaxID=767427 RepID=UPI00187F43AE|nr:glycerate kinase [Phormidium sp. LEGE 05292]MBE9229826.1 glycerate kinase [Phormidium sp. LEGE 05292]